MPVKSSAATRSPEHELRVFLAKYTPEIARFGRGARARVRKLVPGGVEFVYDNYNGLVLGYGPTERPSEAILSLLIETPDIKRFIRLAIDAASPPFSGTSGFRTIIKSVSAKQRPRRP